MVAKRPAKKAAPAKKQAAKKADASKVAPARRPPEGEEFVSAGESSRHDGGQIISPN